MIPSATTVLYLPPGAENVLLMRASPDLLRLGSEIARLSDVHAHAFDTNQRPSRSLSVRRYPGSDLLLVASHFLLDDQDYGDHRRLVGIVGFSLPGASDVPS